MFKQKISQTKSPLTAKPLRNPGESLEKQIEDVKWDEGLIHVLLALIAVQLAALEWYRWYKALPPMPWVFTFLALCISIFAALKLKKAITKIKSLRLGLQGEKAVGQYLEHLRESGARIFHDVPGNGFNLDHVVIHASGVYVVETKTMSKPSKGEARLIYDGQTVSNGKFKPDRNPIIQVRAAQKWLFDILKESTGKEFPIRPVVVYPGWFIEPTAESKASNVWVLNPKGLPSFITNSTTKLTSDEVQLCAFHLGRYIRTSA